MNWWQILLFPFAIIYDLVTRIRNWLYDIGIKRVHTFPDVKIISVGNLSLGGTGKTPMIEFLIRYGIDNDWNMATLSRGYGRRTAGARIASSGDGPKELGDESFGYFDQFGERVVVAVAERRVEGIELIKSVLPDLDVVLLDDAFQHRSVKPNVSFLLTTQKNPFWKDFVLPSGRLRESSKGYRRANMIVVTKCNDNVIAPVKLPVASSSIEYGALVVMGGVVNNRAISLAGLANSDDFFEYVSSKFSCTEQIRFGDHHDYGKEEVRQITEKCRREKAMLITTYKDAVKLKEFEMLSEISWGYIPIKMKFVSGEDEVLVLLHSLDKKP